MLLQVFNEKLTDGPAHITVDGTASNPYVFAAVVLVGVAIAAGTSAAVFLWTSKRALALIFLAGVVVVSVTSEAVYHWVAFLLHSISTRQQIPTTFLGAPSQLLAPLICVAAALLAKLALARTTLDIHE